MSSEESSRWPNYPPYDTQVVIYGESVLKVIRLRALERPKGHREDCKVLSNLRLPDSRACSTPTMHALRMLRVLQLQQPLLLDVRTS
jgi:hypothetical protein